MIQAEDVRKGLRVLLLVDVDRGRRAGDTGVVKCVQTSQGELWGVVFDKEVGSDFEATVITVDVPGRGEVPILSVCDVTDRPAGYVPTRGEIRAVRVAVFDARDLFAGKVGAFKSARQGWAIAGQLPAAVYELPEHLRAGHAFVLETGEVVRCVGYALIGQDQCWAVDAVVGEGI